MSLKRIGLGCLIVTCAAAGAAADQHLIDATFPPPPTTAYHYTCTFDYQFGKGGNSIVDSGTIAYSRSGASFDYHVFQTTNPARTDSSNFDMVSTTFDVWAAGEYVYTRFEPSRKPNHYVRRPKSDGNPTVAVDAWALLHSIQTSRDLDCIEIAYNPISRGIEEMDISARRRVSGRDPIPERYVMRYLKVTGIPLKFEIFYEDSTIPTSVVKYSNFKIGAGPGPPIEFVLPEGFQLFDRDPSSGEMIPATDE